MSRLLLVLALAVALVVPGEAAAKKAPKPLPCAGTRFMVDGDRIVGTVPLADAVVLTAADVVVDSACAGGAKAVAKVTKKRATVTARWKTCAGLAGPAVLVLKLDPNTCLTASGTFKAKKAKIRRKLTGRKAGSPAITAGAYAPVALTGATVGPAGGTVTGDPAGPLAGLVIEVPPGATTEDVTFTVEVADVTGIDGLPTGTELASRLIRITVSGSPDFDLYRAFEKPVRVTLPYTGGEAEETVRFYLIAADGSLEPMGLEAQDQGGHTLTFYTRIFGDTAEPSQLGAGAPAGARTRAARANEGSGTFANYVAVGLRAAVVSVLNDQPLTMDTGFRPAVDGWYVPNYGSYYRGTRGGSCFGFVSSARWYHEHGFAPDLYANYHDPANTPTWVDDAVAIEFTARTQSALADMWNSFLTGETNLQTPSARAVALSYVGGLYVTGEPVLLYIQQALAQAGGTAYSGAHAIMIYRVDVAGGTFTFHVYDPNAPGKDDRRIVYQLGVGFQTYESGTSAASSKFHYNWFKHIAFHLGLSDAVMQALKTAADGGFQNGSVFPQVLVTAVLDPKSGEPATEGTTAEGQHKFVVPGNQVRIQGTILGGLAQDPCCVVNNARVFLSSEKFSTPVNNVAGGGDGTFDVTMPILSGENELVILGAKHSSFSHWAAFYRDVIESTYQPAALTVTLTWGTDQTDVDLYVREPDGEMGQTGDTVYWSHRRGESAEHPYLDLDDTTGLGPEHYIALPGMTTLYADASAAPTLFGDYTARVHYWADHDSNPDEVQPVSWTVRWRQLAYCPAPCASPETDGFWVEGGDSGALASASSGACCNIENGGPSWGDPFTIPYPAPDPADWAIPDPPAVMLP